MLKMWFFIRRHRFWICVILLILEISLLTFANWEWGERQLDSDDSAEMILAELLHRTGGVVSRNWYYSTEIRVLNTQLVMKPLFSFFTDWRAVRAAGTAILLAILAGSFLFLCRSTRIGKSLICASPLILWPFSYAYYDIVLYGLYYIPHLCIIFLTLGLVLNQKEKGRGFRLLVLMILALFTGLGGIRMLAICYIPLLIITVFSETHFFRTGHGRERRFIIRSFFASASCGIGYLINQLILTGKYSFFHWGVHPVRPGAGRITAFLKTVLSVMGIGIPKDLSMRSAGFVAAMIVFPLLVFMVVRLVARIPTMEPEIQILLGYFIASFLVSAAIAIFTDIPWTSRYLIMPCIGFVVVLTIYFREYPLSQPMSRKLFILFAVMELLLGSSTFFVFNGNNKHRDADPAYQYILASGLEFGFGDWDSSDVLTEMSDGRIHMCKLYNYKVPEAWYWLMEKDFRRYGEGKPVFLLLDNGRLSFHGNIGHVSGEWEREDLNYLEAGEIVFHDDRYTIWQYPSLEEFEATARVHF